MTLKQADRIREHWANFLEISYGTLAEFFLNPIPESLLPYPKKAIKEAMEVVAQYFKENGNEAGEKACLDTIPFLDMYQDTEKSLIKFSEMLAGSYKKVIQPHLGITQKKQLKYVLENF